MLNQEKVHSVLRSTAAVGVAIGCLTVAPLSAQDGLIDTSFGTGGKTSVAFDLGGDNWDGVEDVLIQPDGKILLVGSADQAVGHDYSVIVRLSSDGTLDPSFSGDGKQEYKTGLGDESFSAVGLQNDKIIVAGYQYFGLQVYDFIVGRLNDDGSLDTSFSSTGWKSINFDLGPDLHDRLTDMTVQPDGKIVLVGMVQTYLNATDSSMDIGVARLTADGDLDSTFSGDGMMVASFDIGGSKDDEPFAVALQADGKIVVAASVAVSSSDTDMAVIRISTTGSLDTSFGPAGSGGIVVPFNLGGTTNYDHAWDIAVQGRKIVVVGEVDTVAPFTDMAAFRLNSDGTLDTGFSSDGKQTVSFNVATQNWDIASSVALLGDGKILLAGSATMGATDTDFALARLRLDGEIDTTFQGDGKRILPFDLGPDWIDVATAVALQKDGKIVIAGSASTAPGSSDMAVARMHHTAVLFSDGFETGDTEIWSAEAP